MPTTHAIGTGTVNLTVNVPADWRGIIGRATNGALSVGDVLRELIEAGAKVKSRPLWRSLRMSRVKYYGLKRLDSAALLGLFIVGALGHNHDLRRPAATRAPRIHRQDF